MDALWFFCFWSLSICSLEGTVPGPLYTQDLTSPILSIVPRSRHYFPPQYMRKWNEKEVSRLLVSAISSLRLHSMNQRTATGMISLKPALDMCGIPEGSVR